MEILSCFPWLFLLPFNLCHKDHWIVVDYCKNCLQTSGIPVETCHSSNSWHHIPGHCLLLLVSSQYKLQICMCNEFLGMLKPKTWSPIEQVCPLLTASCRTSLSKQPSSHQLTVFDLGHNMNYRTVEDHQGEVSPLTRGHIAGQLSFCAHIWRVANMFWNLCRVIPEFLTKSWPKEEIILIPVISDHWYLNHTHEENKWQGSQKFFGFEWKSFEWLELCLQLFSVGVGIFNNDRNNFQRKEIGLQVTIFD